MSNKALVFSIEEFSVFDGPGIRTSVFFMGCPLRCEWCHNPEGQSFKNRIVRSPNGCIGCQSCVKNAQVINGEAQFTERSISACPRNLLRYCGKEYTADELCAKLLKNAEAAAVMIAEGIRQNKKFRIIGDYDVDGIMSVYILYRIMTAAGAKVDYRIPDRIKDGYGLNEDMVQECIDAEVEIIVTCDNGIAAMEPIALAK